MAEQEPLKLQSVGSIPIWRTKAAVSYLSWVQYELHGKLDNSVGKQEYQNVT